MSFKLIGMKTVPPSTDSAPNTGRPRGRPRAYDPAVVLHQVLDTFWRKGYAGTSVDDLCAATGLNKPSLYAGLGDKQRLYARALEAYLAQVGAGMARALGDDTLTLNQALGQVVSQAVALYQGGRGCFVVSTVPSVAWDDIFVRDTVAHALAAQDAALTARCRQAQIKGEWQADADPAVLGAMVSALLHSLALRARAGWDRQALLTLGEQGLATLLGQAVKLRR